jgi:hypothetical protein
MDYSALTNTASQCSGLRHYWIGIQAGCAQPEIAEKSASRSSQGCRGKKLNA